MLEEIAAQDYSKILLTRDWSHGTFRQKKDSGLLELLSAPHGSLSFNAGERTTYRLWVHQNAQRHLQEIVGQYDAFLVFVHENVRKSIGATEILDGPQREFDIVLEEILDEKNGIPVERDTINTNREMSNTISLNPRRWVRAFQKWHRENVIRFYQALMGHETFHAQSNVVVTYHKEEGRMRGRVPKFYRELIANVWEGYLLSQWLPKKESPESKLLAELRLRFSFGKKKDSTSLDVETHPEAPRFVGYYATAMALRSIGERGTVEYITALLHSPLRGQDDFERITRTFNIKDQEGNYLTYSSAVEAVKRLYEQTQPR